MKIMTGMRAPIMEFSQAWRSEEHTSELQSRFEFVCRLLLEKKKVSLPELGCVSGFRNERVGGDRRTYGLDFALGRPAGWKSRLRCLGGSGLKGMLYPTLV